MISNIRDLYQNSWLKCQPSTQFQGEGSSHELAAILLTECIQFSLYSLKKPAFVLYLDAQSAFDVVQRNLLIKNLSQSQNSDQSLIYQDLRLASRKTVVDWNGSLMGPILDGRGLEQGGINSSDLYKIYGQDQLTMAQDSGLGIHLGDCHVAAIGQADDTALVSNDIHSLFYLLQLSNIFCQKYLVELSADKTILQVFTKNSLDKVDIDANPILINDKTIPFSNQAEHVGVIRSVSRNGPAILARMSAHRKALASVAFTGIAKGQKGNPAYIIRIEKLYATPVLLSGIPTLVLTSKELEMIDLHYINTLRSLLRLSEKTPRSVIFFLAGSLPASALIHMRQLSLFAMICRLQGNILHNHALNFFTSKTKSPKSWFNQVRSCCLQYGLPHPLDLLEISPDRVQFKRMVKKKVIDYWEVVLREESKSLKSLVFFHPSYMSLSKPHPLLSSAGSSPAKVAMAVVQMQMLSGRYRTDSLMRHWDRQVSGFCTFSLCCSQQESIEDLQHFLQICPAFNQTRLDLQAFTELYLTRSNLPPDIADIIRRLCNPFSPSFCNFLLDCSVNPLIIRLAQDHGHDAIYSVVFDITRTWTFIMHRERLKMRGLWKCRRD